MLCNCNLAILVRDDHRFWHSATAGQDTRVAKRDEEGGAGKIPWEIWCFFVFLSSVSFGDRTASGRAKPELFMGTASRTDNKFRWSAVLHKRMEVQIYRYVKKKCRRIGCVIPRYNLQRGIMQLFLTFVLCSAKFSPRGCVVPDSWLLRAVEAIFNF